MVSQFGSLGYTIMGKTDWSDSCPEDNHWHPSQGGQAINIHCQRSWLFTECCIQACWLKVEWKEKVWKKKMHSQPREPQLYEESSKIDSRIWVNFTGNVLRLGSRHQEPPHTDVSRNLATVVVFLLLSHSWTTDHVRGILPGLRRRRTGLLPIVVQSPLFRWAQVLYFIWKPRS